MLRSSCPPASPASASSTPSKIEWSAGKEQDKNAINDKGHERHHTSSRRASPEPTPQPTPQPIPTTSANLRRWLRTQYAPGARGSARMGDETAAPPRPHHCDVCTSAGLSVQPGVCKQALPVSAIATQLERQALHQVPVATRSGAPRPSVAPARAAHSRLASAARAVRTASATTHARALVNVRLRHRIGPAGSASPVVAAWEWNAARRQCERISVKPRCDRWHPGQAGQRLRSASASSAHVA